MAFPVEGLTFGDFSTLTADEYKELFATGNKDDRCLELPWDEEENLMSVLLPLQQGASVTQRYPAGTQQQAPTQQAAPAVQQQEPSYQQQQQQQLQQPQVSISPQQPQVAVTPQQHLQQEMVNIPQQPKEAAVPQYVIDRQTTISVGAHPTPDTSRANPTNMTQQVRGPGGQVYIQPAQPTAVPMTVQAEVYSEKTEEGAQSSDGGNNSGNNTDDGDGKRRRNKKRRDPNYYKTFYENPALYGRKDQRRNDNAYYADNESSSGSSGPSSGNTSEVHGASQETMPDSVIIDMTPKWQMEPNVNMAAHGAIPHAAVHMQQSQIQAVNRTSGMHHGGYVANPAYMNVQDGATVMLDGQTLPVSGQPPPQAGQPLQLGGHPAPQGPPGLQHSAAAAAVAAVQLQKSLPPHVMPATTNVQNVINYEQRTIPPDANQGLSIPPSGNATKPTQSVLPRAKTVDNVNVPTVQRYVFDTTINSTLNADVSLNFQQQEASAPAQQQGQIYPANTQTSSPGAPEVSPAMQSAQASIPMSPPHASSSTSASPGSTTPIVSPMSTPVASPQPPVTSPQPPAASPPSDGAIDIAASTAATADALVAETLPAAESAPAADEESSADATQGTVPEQETEPAAPAQVPASPWGKQTSWAGLFKSSSASAPLIITTPYDNSTTGDKGEFEHQNNSRSAVSPDDDPRAKELADILSNISLSNRNAFLRPRGLINAGNWCYINSILQALVACPPLTNLVRALPLRSSKQQKQEATSTPMLNALVQFFYQFTPVPPKIRDKIREIRPGPSFEPTMVYHMLSAVNISLVVKQGRQEDAEEFLSCLLNGLHEEMLAVMGSVKDNKLNVNSNGPAGGDVNNKHVDGNHVNETPEEDEEDDDDDEWEQVGPKNKSSVTRGAHFTQTPMSKIFGGQMRSALHQQGSRESATLQPFFTLQLDIQDEKIWSVRDALDNLGLRENLQGFTCTKTKVEVEASRRITLEELPPVLVLHLKCFVYDKTGGCQKLIKKLDYNMDLEISKDLLSPSLKARASVSQRSFRLMAVVYHVGKEASGGHYITDIFHSGLNSWMRMDDSNVRFIKAHQVVKPQSSLTPYLLFYRRNDCAAQS